MKQEGTIIKMPEASVSGAQRQRPGFVPQASTIPPELPLSQVTATSHLSLTPEQCYVARGSEPVSLLVSSSPLGYLGTEEMGELWAAVPTAALSQ